MPTITGHGGLSIAFESVGDPDLVFIHANGFCKEVWDPVIEELGVAGFVSIDQPGHGDSDAPDPPFEWWDFGRHALAVLEGVGASKPIGVGHSSGAAALAMAEILRPGVFARLVLIEPILPPPPYGRLEDHPLALSALRRRISFPSATDAAEAYRGRGPFALWDERALLAYVEGGFHSDVDGWSLKCRPDVEAEVYRTSEAHGAWERLGEIGCRVDLVVGANSDTHPEPFARRQAARFPDSRIHLVPAATHFVPMERPAAVAAIVRGE